MHAVEDFVGKKEVIEWWSHLRSVVSLTLFYHNAGFKDKIIDMFQSVGESKRIL